MNCNELQEKKVVIMCRLSMKLVSGDRTHDCDVRLSFMQSGRASAVLRRAFSGAPRLPSAGRSEFSHLGVDACSECSA